MYTHRNQTTSADSYFLVPYSTLKAPLHKHSALLPHFDVVSVVGEDEDEDEDGDGDYGADDDDYDGDDYDEYRKVGLTRILKNPRRRTRQTSSVYDRYNKLHDLSISIPNK